MTNDMKRFLKYLAVALGFVLIHSLILTECFLAKRISLDYFLLKPGLFLQTMFSPDFQKPTTENFHELFLALTIGWFILAFILGLVLEVIGFLIHWETRFGILKGSWYSSTKVLRPLWGKRGKHFDRYAVALLLGIAAIYLFAVYLPAAWWEGQQRDFQKQKERNEQQNQMGQELFRRVVLARINKALIAKPIAMGTPTPGTGPYTPEELDRSEVTWSQTQRDGRLLTLVQVIVGGKQWAGLCCGVEGWQASDTRFYLAENSGNALSVREFFRCEDALCKAGFMDRPEAQRAHLDVVINEYGTDHYFTLEPAKGLKEVLSCESGYVWAHSVPPPPCEDTWDSALDFPSVGTVRVTTNWNICDHDQTTPPPNTGSDDDPPRPQIDYPLDVATVNYPIKRTYHWDSQAFLYKCEDTFINKQEGLTSVLKGTKGWLEPHDLKTVTLDSPLPLAFSPGNQPVFESPNVLPDNYQITFHLAFDLSKLEKGKVRCPYYTSVNGSPLLVFSPGLAPGQNAKLSLMVRPLNPAQGTTAHFCVEFNSHGYWNGDEKNTLQPLAEFGPLVPEPGTWWFTVVVRKLFENFQLTVLDAKGKVLLDTHPIHYWEIDGLEHPRLYVIPGVGVMDRLLMDRADLETLN